jgi:hypothetical protein
MHGDIDPMMTQIKTIGNPRFNLIRTDLSSYIYCIITPYDFFYHLKEISTRHRKESPTHNFFSTDD